MNPLTYFIGNQPKKVPPKEVDVLGQHFGETWVQSKPISIAIVYKPSTDNLFLDYLSRGLNDFDLMENDLFILGDTNINILSNGENIFDNYKVVSKKNLILVLLLKSLDKFVLL